MTYSEIDRKINMASVAADSLAAVIVMTNEHYFDSNFDSLGENYWRCAYAQLCGVMGALETLSAGICDALEELTLAKIEPAQTQEAME